MLLNQLVRYEQVIRELRQGRVSSILDVGSGSVGISAFAVAEWEITLCDVDFSDYGVIAPVDDRVRRVPGTILELPFSDGEFDAVVALDVMEHLAPGERDRALDELARVARRIAIVACPTGEAALLADCSLARYYDRIHRRRPAWLEEHLVNGFPEARELAERFRGHGSVRVVPSESVRAHWIVGLAEASIGGSLVSAIASRALARAISAPDSMAGAPRRILRLLRGRDQLPSYRSIVVLVVDR